MVLVIHYSCCISKHSPWLLAQSLYNKTISEYAGMLEDFSVSAMADKTETSFYEAGQSLRECMPHKVKQVFDAVASLDNLASIAEGIREGKNQSGALETTLLLAKVKQAEEGSPPMASARNYSGDYKMVWTHWWLLVEAHVEKCHKAKKVNEFLKKYGNLEAGIKAWDFSKLPWVTAEKDEDRDKMGKSVQEMFLVFPTWNSVLERIDKEMQTFANKSQQEVVTEALAITRTAATQMGAAKILAAEMIIVGQFVQGEREGKTVEQVKLKPEYAPAMNYIRKQLKIDVSQLPGQLQDRIMGNLAETTTAAESSGTKTPVELADDAADGLPKKKESKAPALQRLKPGWGRTIPLWVMGDVSWGSGEPGVVLMRSRHPGGQHWAHSLFGKGQRAKGKSSIGRTAFLAKAAKQCMMGASALAGARLASNCR